MRALDNWKFTSVVLLTFCGTKDPGDATAKLERERAPMARTLLPRSVCGLPNCAPRTLPPVSRSGSS